MRKFIVTTNITLDGVMQAPHASEEDPSGAFSYGGWSALNADAITGKAVQNEMNQPAEYLLGRKTFEIFASFWPTHAPMWSGINEATKYIFSSTIDHSNWNNTVFLRSLTDIQALKRSAGADVWVWGSSELIHLLLANGLVDELHLRIFPLILGKGKKLFDSGSVPTAFRLAETVVTPKGVIVAHYVWAGEVLPSQTVRNLLDTYLNH